MDVIMVDQSDKIEITEDIRDELVLLKKRSGVGVHALLKGTRQTRPAGLTAPMVEGWFTVTRFAKQEHLNYVLTLWRERSEQYMDVTQDMLDFLSENRTKIRIHMKYAKDLPKGLNRNAVSSWIARKNTRIRSEHWAYVSGGSFSVQD